MAGDLRRRRRLQCGVGDQNFFLRRTAASPKLAGTSRSRQSARSGPHVGLNALSWLREIRRSLIMRVLSGHQCVSRIEAGLCRATVTRLSMSGWGHWWKSHRIPIESVIPLEPDLQAAVRHILNVPTSDMTGRGHLALKIGVPAWRQSRRCRRPANSYNGRRPPRLET